MICLKLNWFFNDPIWMLKLSNIVWMLRSLVWEVFNNFLLIDATDRRKMSSNQKCLFFAVSLHFLRTLPLKNRNKLLIFRVHFKVITTMTFFIDNLLFIWEFPTGLNTPIRLGLIGLAVSTLFNTKHSQILK